MRELPFLVVHGATVAKALVAATTAAGLGLVWRVRRRRDAAHGDHELRTRLDRVTAPLDGDATVRGTLREAGRERWLDCGGERIDLAGELAVVRGTRMTWLRGQPMARHTVHDGDDVIASGHLERNRGGDEAYRGQATGWVMTSAAGAPAIELVAARPAVRGRRPGLAGLVVCGLASYGALFGAGKLALSQIDKVNDLISERVSADSVPSFGATVVAAALPGSRDQALQALRGRFGRAIAHTPEVLEMQIALGRLAGDCHDAAWWLRTSDRFEQALDVAEGCDPGETVATLLSLGRYDEAARLAPTSTAADSPEPFGPWDDQSKASAAVSAAIMVGRWDDAAKLADGWVARFARQHSVAVDPLVANDVTGVICLSELFRARSGDSRAIERLHKIAASTRREACSEVEAIATGSVDEIRRVLVAIPERERQTSAMRVIAWAYGVDDLGGEGPAPLDQHGLPIRLPPPAEELTGGTANGIVWLAPFALAAHDSPSSRRWVAAYHTLVGDFAAARRDLRAIDTQFPAERRDEALELAIELHLGEPLGPRHAPADSAEQQAWTRAGTSKEDFAKWMFDDRRDRQAFEESCPAKLEAAFWATFPNDGAPLASLMAYCPNKDWSSRLALAVLPYVTVHRDELHEVLRGFRDRYDLSIANPFYLVHHAMMQRDLMRLSGDAVAAARWQALVDRHAKVLADRDRVIALMMWTHRGPT